MKATNNFGDKLIGSGGFGKVYKGELNLREGWSTVAFKRLDRRFGQGDIEFWKEIVMLSKLRHENLVSLLHFCNEGEERILVYEYASRGSLNSHLGDPNLTWTRSLQICIGVANGLRYLHDPRKTQNRVLHRDIKSPNILLDEKWNAKLSDFGLSKLGPANQSRTYLISNVVGTHGYCDPWYYKTHELTKESDIYSFGVVLFEVVCGRTCHEFHDGELVSILVNAWQNCYDEERLGDIIYDDSKENIDEESLKTFSTIANRCLNFERAKRPTMAEIIEVLDIAFQQQNTRREKPNVVKSQTSYESREELHHLKVDLQDIVLATNNFDPERLIGRGGFGSVYKGELHLWEGRNMIAFKRLDRKLGQGNTEFWREINMLSKYRHENLVSLLCFCDEGDERILGYELAPRGSLDHHLSDLSLTWTQRIKICIGVARALKYLHEPKETQRRVLHRDIKSSNILLNEEWNAKVTDFGLSKFGPVNLGQTFLATNVVGTVGYLDPFYFEAGILTKESDIYSLGVVLFEVMCGKSSNDYRGGQLRVLVPTWKKHYTENRLDDIVCSDLLTQMDTDSLTMFSAIASQCLHSNRRERPTISEIVKKLEIALEQQELFEEMMKVVHLVVPPLLYTSQNQLHSLLSKGILVGDGKTWLSINKNKKTREMISAIKCVFGDLLLHDTSEGSRFSNVLSGVMHDGFRVEVTTQFLLPRITYTVNLVFKHSGMDHETHIPFKFKFDAERRYYNLSIGHAREDGWMMIESCRFTSYKREHDFKIEFLPLFDISSSNIQYFLEGIEFRRVEYVS